jgi:hypothetical protein
MVGNIVRHISSSSASRQLLDRHAHVCEVGAEPSHRHQRGGYHLILLIDFLKDSRYGNVHKLGWGGYSMWAARIGSNVIAPPPA